MNNTTPRKILITGASGVLGQNLAFFLNGRHRLTGVYWQHPVELAGVHMVQADLLSTAGVRQLIQSCNPDVVIHGAALPYIDQCEKDPDLARRQNVKMVANMAQALEGSDKKLIFISTDNVYDDRGDHAEDEPCVPVNEYGRTKFAGEKMARTFKNTLVLRTTFFGCGNASTKTHSEQMILALSKGQKVKGFDDVLASPLYVGDLGRIVEGLIQKDLTGIFNVGAGNGISKFELLRLLALGLGLNADLIEPISVDSLSLPAARNKNAVMKTERIAAVLGRPMPSVAQGVEHFTRDLKQKLIPPASVLANFNFADFASQR